MLASPTQNITVTPPSPFREFWQYFSGNPGAFAGFIVIVVIALLALFAPWVAPHSPIEQYRDFAQLPPAWISGNWDFILGTDDIGRDIASRLIYGARISFLIGCIVVSLSLSIGVSLGLLAGYFQGGLDILIMRIMDTMMAVPSLLLAIAVVAVLGPGLTNAMIAVAVVEIPFFARITRSAVLTECAKDYVMASRIMGAGTARQLFSNILPNCMAPIIVQASLGFSSAILSAAALGFLGLGAQPPTPEWGTMLADARQFIQRAWWMVTFPGLAIMITVLAFNLMGDGLRDALDPKLKR